MGQGQGQGLGQGQGCRVVIGGRPRPLVPQGVHRGEAWRPSARQVTGGEYVKRPVLKRRPGEYVITNAMCLAIHGDLGYAVAVAGV